MGTAAGVTEDAAAAAAARQKRKAHMSQQQGVSIMKRQRTDQQQRPSEVNPGGKGTGKRCAQCHNPTKDSRKEDHATPAKFSQGVFCKVPCLACGRPMQQHEQLCKRPA